MRNMKICLFLLGLATLSLQTNAGGYESVKIRANDDPQACLLSLTVTPSPNSITFTETIDRTNSTSCSFPNPQFVSQFTNQPLSNQVVLNPTANASVYQGVMSLSDLAALNGTACFNYMTAGAVKWYLCRMKYGLNIFFEFSVIMAPNSDLIDPSWTNLFFPIYLTSYVGKNFVWFKDPILWGPLVAKMSQTCGTWSSNIPSASTPVKLTGTIQSSSEVNLHNYFHSHQVYGAVIKPTGAPAGQYIVTSINNMAFSTNTNSSCADLGINYGQLLGGNMNYCKNGCDVALILIQGTYYILQTSGFTYVPPALRG